jgi:hypothetical protein
MLFSFQNILKLGISVTFYLYIFFFFYHNHPSRLEMKSSRLLQIITLHIIFSSQGGNYSNCGLVACDNV